MTAIIRSPHSLIRPSAGYRSGQGAGEPASAPSAPCPVPLAGLARKRALGRTVGLALGMTLGLAACSPAPVKSASVTSASVTGPGTTAPAQAAPATASPSPALAPDVAAAMAAGAADPRVPTVDPASITDASSVGDIMRAFIIPGSETLFAAETEGAPADDAGWAKLQKGAADVIRGAELLKTAGRSKGKAWDATLDTVITATRVTASALARKNADDLVFTDGDMMAGCTSCHQQFRDQKPPEGHLIGNPP